MLMVDPVVAADGHTYERANIERWVAGKRPPVMSFKTGARLSKCLCVRACEWGLF